MNLSAVITAKNEENVIKRCLTSIDFADEIIVIIDTNSTDNTAHPGDSCGGKCDLLTSLHQVGFNRATPVHHLRYQHYQRPRFG